MQSKPLATSKSTMETRTTFREDESLLYPQCMSDSTLVLTKLRRSVKTLHSVLWEFVYACLAFILLRGFLIRICYNNSYAHGCLCL